MKAQTQLNYAVLLGVSSIGLAAWVPAVAQVQRETDPDIEASSASGEAGQLQEILVTAQRRSERLQDVPIAVNTISADTALRAGISGTDTLQVAVPGLEFGRQSGNGGAPYLRGVGTNASIAGTEPPVAIYLDDIYVGTAQASLFEFNSVDQIEVLKGPQGTLFGRNATGGVIQVRTRRPSRDTAVDTSIGFGRFDTVDGALYANTPLSDTVAANVSMVGHKQHDGYGRNLTSGEDASKNWNYGFLGRLLWEPSASTSLLISADYSEQWSDQGLQYHPFPGALLAGGTGFQSRYASTVTPGVGANFDFEGVSARLDQDLGFAQLVSISGYRVTKQHAIFDQDRAAPNILTVDVTSRTENFSQELQLQSNEGTRLQWIVGAFYLRSEAALKPLRAEGSSQAANGGFNDTRNEQILNSYAVFADGRYEILPRTNLTLGVRYTRDEYALHVDPVINGTGQTLVGGFSTSEDFPKATYRAVLDYKITPDVMVYGSHSRGFKSGGYNLGGTGGPPNGEPPVSPEVLDAYEIGLKAEFLNRRLRANLSAYHYDYTNLQTNVVVGSTATLINAAAAKIDGIDVELNALLGDRLAVSLGGSYIDGKYDNFPAGESFIPNPAVCTPTPMTTGPLTGGNRRCPENQSGNRVIRTPKFTATASVSYTIPTNHGEFQVSGTLYHNSGFYWAPDNRTEQDDYQLLNSTITWTSPAGKYELALWGNNLLNRYYLDYAIESTSGDVRAPAPPRTFGVRAGYHF